MSARTISSAVIIFPSAWCHNMFTLARANVTLSGRFALRCQLMAMTGDRRRRTGTTESWHRAMVTPELTISARNIKDEDAYMLDAVARILKKLLWEAWEE